MQTFERGARVTIHRVKIVDRILHFSLHVIRLRFHLRNESREKRSSLGAVQLLLKF